MTFAWDEVHTTLSQAFYLSMSLSCNL